MDSFRFWRPEEEATKEAPLDNSIIPRVHEEANSFDIPKGFNIKYKRLDKSEIKCVFLINLIITEKRMI